MQQASIGRIVHVRNEGGDPIPAIITKVHHQDDERALVNYRLLGEAGLDVITSAKVYASPEQAANRNGADLYVAYWPPRAS
jgi:hypothetical protein